ncbi:phospholipase D-like domain-containing protein [Rubritalea marina]|uniref:phospholipase D-like domain-containing protein n=1 Tax=Rubritalea marina TaxID=361055 RepID=UPI00039B62FD|nr:phospholipase D-like domain-containing protein [Rubritalea marina]
MRRFLSFALVSSLLLGLCSCAKLSPSPYAALSSSAPKVNHRDFTQKMASTCRATWTHGNHIETLVNGAEYFPAMLEAIESAEQTITFETFVAINAQVTYELVMALKAKAEQGVKVHFVVDGIGSRKLPDWYLDTLRDAGAEVHIYRPLRPHNFWRCNNRDHRKVMVIDGKLGFTGGAGYADVWDGDCEHHWRWRDTMYRLEGPIVAHIQHAFNDNWEELTGRRLSGAEYFPKPEKAGSMQAIGVLGAPQEQGDTLGASYLLAIDAAKHSILIGHAYFLPNKTLRDALFRARKRGVEIDIILPNETIDSKMIRLTSKTYWREMLDAGMRIYEFDSGMLHGKLIVVDDSLSIIGSGNFDDRTFFINDEFNVNVLSKRFAAEQRAMFEDDLKKSKPMSWSDAKVPLYDKPQQWLGRLIEPQL